MHMTIVNRSDRQVLIRLRSGLTRILGPGEVADDLESVEVLGNARIAHLHERGLISIAMSEPKPARPARGTAPARPAKKRAVLPAGRRAKRAAERAATPATNPTADSN